MPDRVIREMDPIDNPPVNAPFHWQDGYYFQRLLNGAVLMTMPHGQGQKVIPPNEWASIVAHVSHKGENAETWQAALNFHGDTVSHD